MRQNNDKIKSIAGRVIIAGFEGLSLPSNIKKKISEGSLGGIVLFKRNVANPGQVAELLQEARSLARADQQLLFCVDQEGGRVVRLRSPLTVLNPARKFGDLDDPTLSHDAGQLVARELGAVGFTVNFAPVLDVDTNPESPVIGDRSYGSTPEKVIEHGLAFGKGLISCGIVPCAKHFPGHGDAAIDSHLSLPKVTHDVERLRQVEMEPFRAWVKADLGPIMTAHVVYPSLDPDNPATFSHSIVSGQLRDKLGFKGAVFSDDLEMGAVSEIGGPKRAAVTCINAGVDGLLVCRDEDLQQGVREKLIHEAEKNLEFKEKLETASTRIESIPKYPQSSDGVKWLGSNEHQKMKSSLVARLGGEVL